MAGLMVATTDIRLEDEVVQRGRLPKDAGYFENFGTMVLAEAEDHDVMLWTSCNQVGGSDPGHWIVPDATMQNTSLVMLPKNARGAMQDNAFIHAGTSQQEYLAPADLKVTEENDRNTWQIKDWQFIARPPYWDVKGSHAGIAFDLTLAALGPALWYKGPWENLSRTEGQRIAGFEQICAADGSLTINGKAFRLSDGYAVHEHVVNGPGFDFIPMFARQAFHWVLGFNGDLQFYAFTMTGRAYARVLLQGQELTYDEQDVSLAVLDLWEDPLSGMRVPCRWHLNLCSANGILDLDIAAGGRAYHFYVNKTGYWCPYWYLALANGRFIFPNGRIVPIKDMRVGIERGRTVLTNQGIAAGER